MFEEVGAFERVEDTSEQGRPFVESWHLVDPAGWTQVAQWTDDIWGITNNTMIRGRVDLAAEKFGQEEGRWPSATELVQFPVLQRYMNNLAAGFPFLPPQFAVDGQVFLNDPLEGPKALTKAGSPLPSQALLTDPGAIDQFVNESGGVETQNFRGLSVSSDELGALLRKVSPVRTRRSGGGGGGGGGGRADIVFDRNQLISSAKDQLRTLLFQDPVDVEKIVDDYTKQANAFWRSKGGRLDFQTFVEERGLDTARARALYRNKPDVMAPREYIAQFVNTASGFGLSADTTRQFVEQGARFNLSQEGFATQVSRSRESQVRNSGTFSQRFAAVGSQLGGIMRS